LGFLAEMKKRLKHDCLHKLLKDGILHEVPSGTGRSYVQTGVAIENNSDEDILVLILEVRGND